MNEIRAVAERAKSAARALAGLGTEEKKGLLMAIADGLNAQEKKIRKANDTNQLSCHQLKKPPSEPPHFHRCAHHP